MKRKQFTPIGLILLLLSCGHSRHGYQGYVEGENIYLASPNSGALIKLFVHRGEQVHRGQLLCWLDDDPQLLIVKQNEADLLQAKKILLDLKKPRRTPEIDAIEAQIGEAEAQLKLAALRMSRMQSLYKKQAIDRDSVDLAVATYEEKQQLKAEYQANLALAKLGSRQEQIKAQEKQVLALTAKFNETKWQLSQKRIYAPTDGFIFDTYFREGEFVPSQHAVLSLLPPANVRVEFFVPLSALPSLHLNQAIQFSCEGCLKTARAWINYVSPEAEYLPPLVYSRENNDKLVFRIKAKIEHPDEFKPGQAVWVTLP